MAKSKIEWCDRVWNPVTGCSKISPGCQNCYAERMSKRLAGRYGYPKDEPFKVTFHPERLKEPFKWKKSWLVFVCSMGDLFHDDVPDKFIYDVWDVMVLNKQHTFLILTKRPGRMKNFIDRVMTNRMKYAYTLENTQEGARARAWSKTPVQHIWLGVTAEDQTRADERIPILLQTPAAVRFVSVEPMLGPVDLQKLELGPNGHGLNFAVDSLTGWSRGYNEETGFQKVMRNDEFNRLDWVICGGETGPGARPIHPDWVRSLRDQCQAAEIPFFFKQWGEWLECKPRALRGVTKYKTIQAHGTHFIRLGKKNAGRKFGGQEWNQFPEVSQ